MPTYYDILRVPEDADDKQIKAAYRQAALAYHPDHIPKGVSKRMRDDAAQAWLEVQEAFSVLSDSRKKAQYDALLGEMRRAEELENEFDEGEPATPPPSPPQPTPSTTPQQTSPQSTPQPRSAWLSFCFQAGRHWRKLCWLVAGFLYIVNGSLNPETWTATPTSCAVFAGIGVIVVLVASDIAWRDKGRYIINTVTAVSLIITAIFTATISPSPTPKAATGPRAATFPQPAVTTSSTSTSSASSSSKASTPENVIGYVAIGHGAHPDANGTPVVASILEDHQAPKTSALHKKYPKHLILEFYNNGPAMSPDRVVLFPFAGEGSMSDDAVLSWKSEPEAGCKLVLLQHKGGNHLGARCLDEINPVESSPSADSPSTEWLFACYGEVASKCSLNVTKITIQGDTLYESQKYPYDIWDPANKSYWRVNCPLRKEDDEGHWVGTCTYSLIWVEEGKPDEVTCSVETPEEMTVRATEINGLSGKVDWSPLHKKNDPSCPVAGTGLTEYHLVPWTPEEVSRRGRKLNR